MESNITSFSINLLVQINNVSIHIMVRLPPCYLIWHLYRQAVYGFLLFLHALLNIIKNIILYAQYLHLLL